MKKKVIAYLHTHWDREWYREYEVFRLRLFRVLDNVLDLLEQWRIPCFYFDGQTSALEDYLELNPEKEKLVRSLIKQKKLFIGPCYTLVDEFLTDEASFRKNLEIGMEYSKNLGCEDFLGYFADTFGHSKNIPSILKEFNIDKAVVWRGCSDEIPSEFLFNGVKTVNLIRGYFNDIFSTDKTIEEKAKFLKEHLDKIAQKSSNVLLMPIGADHLGVKRDIAEQVRDVNKLLQDYEIELSSPFKYFDLVKNNFKYEHNDELRDNSLTFILQGSYSARMKLKQLNTEASYKLDLANRFQIFAQKKYKTKSYDNVIKYAYKLLLQNLAHDGICGCSVDAVHRENEVRYEKVLQIADTIIKEIIYESGEKSIVVNLSNHEFTGVVDFESCKKFSQGEFETVSKRNWVCNNILYATQKIPVTEDFQDVYTYLTYIENKVPSRLLSKTHKTYGGNYSESDLNVSDNVLENSKIAISIENCQINLKDKQNQKEYKNFVEFVDYKDLGDSYNFAPDANDKGKKAKLISSKILRKGELQSALICEFEIDKTVLNTQISLNKNSHLLNFKIKWDNKTKNHLLQAKFNLPEPIEKTLSQDMGELIERNFNPDYDTRKNLSRGKGIEVKTNTAPMQNYVSAQGFEVITKGLTEYEVSKNSLLITMLRAIGIISNPLNPARTTPAGPPIEVEGAQQLGQNCVEFSIGFSNDCNWKLSIAEVFPRIIISNE